MRLAAEHNPFVRLYLWNRAWLDRKWEWHRCFLIFPRVIDDTLVVFETVERKLIEKAGWGFKSNEWSYRFITK